MKKILLALSIVLGLNTNAQTTIAGGAVYGTWTLAGSPYIIQSSVVVPNDSTLTIQPGVVVSFQGHYKILALGRILAMGNPTDSIYFTTTNTSIGWYGVRFDNTTANNDTSKFFYCSMQYGIANGSSGSDPYGGAFMFNNFSKAVVSNCLLKNNTVNAIYCTNASPVIINNTISYNSGGGIYILNTSNPYIAGNKVSYNNGAGIWGGTNLTIYNNVITHNNVCGHFCRQWYHFV
ncbi:MAG TPA: right-handed parallel beta-helix repeat-containing protein [Bacteroidia bacterium]|nr:right-handed parallel beta-helix repeat-containing protein [Bacteroidia bacterium]